MLKLICHEAERSPSTNHAVYVYITQFMCRLGHHHFLNGLQLLPGYNYPNAGEQREEFSCKRTWN